MQLTQIKILVLDVDGVLTDGGLYYNGVDEPSSRFDIQDGLSIVIARNVGLEIAIISGRESEAVTQHAGHLGIKEVIQGASDKAKALHELAEKRGWTISEIAFMGDDLNDLPALRVAGKALAPANAVPEVKEIAAHITESSGGNGAVREAIQSILQSQGKWQEAVEKYLQTLVA